MLAELLYVDLILYQTYFHPTLCSIFHWFVSAPLRVETFFKTKKHLAPPPEGSFIWKSHFTSFPFAILFVLTMYLVGSDFLAFNRHRGLYTRRKKSFKMITNDEAQRKFIADWSDICSQENRIPSGRLLETLSSRILHLISD